MAYSKSGGYGRGNGGSYGNQRYTKPVVAPTERKRLATPSSYQITIFDSIRVAGLAALRNIRTYAAQMASWRPGQPMPEPPPVIGIHIDALAGCGKTTTEVEKDYYLPAELLRDSVQVAFNFDIATVLKNRVADGVEAKTIHALGRQAVVKAYPKLNSRSATDNRKYDGYIKAELGTERKTMVARENLRQMMDRARDYLAWTAADMEPLIDQFEMETGHLTRAEFLALAEKILIIGLNDTKRIDFGDMIAMPIYHNLQIRRYSVVSVDEYQDLCPSQHELLDRSVKPGGLMITCGDENQAIYIWRGASTDSIDRGVGRYNSQRFPLPCTYRCGRAIVAAAQEYVPGLECPEGAHEGEVIVLPIEELLDTVDVGDAILSRLNAPLLKLCFALIRLGIPANIMGRDVAEHLKFMVKRSGAETVNALLEWTEKWREAEVARREGTKKPIESVNDTAECISTLCEGRFEIHEVIQAIEDLFPDPKKMPERIVLLSTIHRAKGKEWKRVAVLEDTCFLKNGNQREERNLAYVARTRAMHVLWRVRGTLR